MQENINAFLRVLDASDNSTGGGTASSIAGAMAAGLAAMVARLSMNKKNLAPTQTYQTIATEAEALSAGLFTGGYEERKDKYRGFNRHCCQWRKCKNRY